MVILFSVLFGVITVLIGVYGYKLSAKTAEDYMLTSRTLGIIVMFFFIFFGVMSAWTMIMYPGSMYLQGPGFSFFGWGVILGYAFFLIMVGPRLWAVARLNRYLSPFELLGERYESPLVRLLFSIVTLIFLIPYIGIQPLGVGVSFQAMAQVPIIWGALFLIVLMIIVVMLGGMRATAWVNVFLGIVCTLALAGALVWVIKVALPGGGLIEAAQKLSKSNPELLGVPGPPLPNHPFGIYTPLMIIGTGFIGLCCMGFPHITIGLMATRDKSIFKSLAIIFIAAGGLFYALPPILGSLVAPAIMPGVTGKAADYVLQSIVVKLLPSWFSTFFLMGIVAAALSSVCVMLMGAGIMISRDIIYGSFKRDATDAQLILWTRLGMLVMIIGSFIAAMLYPGQAAYVATFASSGLFHWLPAIFGGLIWKRGTKHGAIAGYIAGIGYLIAGYIFPKLFWMHTAPAMFLNIFVYVIVSLLTRPNSEETQAKFFDEVDEYLSSG